MTKEAHNGAFGEQTQLAWTDYNAQDRLEFLKLANIIGDYHISIVALRVGFEEEGLTEDEAYEALSVEYSMPDKEEFIADQDFVLELLEPDTIALTAGPTLFNNSRRSRRTRLVNGHVPEDSLDMYFSDIETRDLLSAEQEVILAKKIEHGAKAARILELWNQSVVLPRLGFETHRGLNDVVAQAKTAKEIFIESNTRLVINIAAKFTNRSTQSLAELIQEGNLGLIRAVEKFDWRKGFKFSTYATWWIRQAIQRGISSNDRTVRLPVGIHDALVKSRAARARLIAEGNHSPTPEQIAAATKLTAEQVIDVFQFESLPTSLDRKVGNEKDSAEMKDFLPSQEQSPEEEAVHKVSLEQMVKEIDIVLDKRSAFVLKQRFGLNGEDAKTLQEVADNLGVSRETVRKIEVSALGRLKNSMTRSEVNAA